MPASSLSPTAGTPPLGALTLLRACSVPEWRHHPWRLALAVVAVALGVALAFSVHLINESALAEFSGAVRAANGQPDLTLRATQREGFDDALHARALGLPGVDAVSPVLELEVQALAGDRRQALKLVGVDALVVAPLAPSLMPRPADNEDRLAILDPDAVFLNPAALQRLGVRTGDALAVQRGFDRLRLRVAGTVAADGPPLGVIDIAAAQAHFDRRGRLDRLDLRLVPGASADAVRQALPAPTGAAWAAADDAAQRVSNLSRAYRVNLTVLALVALFVGAFLVFSVQALSVAQRTPQLALLGVLGLSPRERARLVQWESAGVGVAGAMLGLAGGTALAWLALRWLAGDLGGGYFPGIAPTLRWSPTAALAFGALGVLAALVGGWMPSAQARRLEPAQALKGLGGTAARAWPVWAGPALLLLGGALALLPPWGGLPIAAYVSVAVLLVGGIVGVPAVVGAVLDRVRPGHHPLALLAVARARHERHAATVAVAGVVASLSLAVALTVMVASFRLGVAQWLDQVLPADLYVRNGAGGSGGTGVSDSAFLPPAFVERASRLPGVARAESLRVRPLQLDPARPAVALIARPVPDATRVLPLVEPPRPPSGPEPAVWVSEAMVSLYGAAPGRQLTLPIGPGGADVRVQVLGVWRDYARQFGAIAMDDQVYRRLSGDDRVNDVALWLADATPPEAVQAALRALPGGELLEFAVPAQIRALSLAIFDRSFAVTYYLQAVAVGIGLFGIAASFSAQVLARRREFGLLAHLGLTRRQVVAIVAGEGAAWTAAGTLVGLVLGLVVSIVLVKVVNPQSFHWTMDLALPWPRLAALAAAVGVAGSLTAAVSARAAAGRDAVLAVKEDW